MNLKHDVREIFRKYMYEHDITQSELGERIGLSKTAISRIMNERIGISLTSLENYCRKLGIEMKIIEDLKNQNK